MYSKCLFLLTAMAVLFISACAPSKQMVSIENSEKEQLADSLKAKFTISLKNEKGEMQDLSGVLFAVKGVRYRLELSGPFGVGVASFLWNKEGWIFSLPTEKMYLDGKGDYLGLSVPIVNIHQLANFFYGQLLPVSHKELIKKDSLDVETIFAEDSQKRPFQFVRKKASGQILSLMQIGPTGVVETIHYEDPKDFEGLTIPSKFIFYQNNEKFLVLSLKKIQREATWGSGVWRLNIPQNYKKLNP